MVSKARLDLPEPERPVTTINWPRGISSDTFLRLCTRAPCTAMVLRAAGLAFLELIVLELTGRFSQVNERHFFHGGVAFLGELDGYRDFADQALIGQVLACRRDACDIVMPLEPYVDLAGRSGFGSFAQVVEHQP